MKPFNLLCLMVIMHVNISVGAQITIGSPTKPAPGALLDLKQESDGTSKKGLGLPRVALQAYDKLQMGVSAPEHTDKTAHSGLVVYNVNPTFDKCVDSSIPSGLHVWDGGKWNGINTIKRPAQPNINHIQQYYSVPSGHDARGTVTAQNITIAWTPDTHPLTYVPNHTFGGGILVGGVPLVAGQLTSPPAVYNIIPDVLTIDPSSPWQSKETVLTLTASNECGASNIMPITFNQTHFAMKVNGNFENSVIITPLKDTNNKTFDVQTNNVWRVILTDPKNILASKAPLSGGADNRAGGDSSTSFTYTASPGGVGTRYQTAILKFEDYGVPKRAKDVTVTMTSCLGTGKPDVSGLQKETPANSNIVNWKTAWGNKVIVHQAKPGVYEEFISADFGLAGRWMTTNLSARAYDGVSHSGGRSLTGPNGNTGFPINTAYWAYPKADGVINTNDSASSEYTANPYLGFLYTWDAATAGKGGSNGQGNVDNISGGAGANDESGFLEGTTAGKQKRRQGICPAGWHLPSDAEFTDLENRIKNFTTEHSTMPSNLGTTTNDTSYGNTTSIDISIGKAMRDICEPGDNYSKFPSDGGFSMLLAGYVYNGSTSNYRESAYLWSSSSYAANKSLPRFMSSGNLNMLRTNQYRFIQYAVRCKKD